MKKQYKNLLFDWDGTVCDSGASILEAVKYAAEQLELDQKDEETLKAFIGPPLKESFSSIYGLNTEETQEAVRIYREKYSGDTMYHTELYADIPDVLRELSKKYRLYIATSKPEHLVLALAEYFNITSLFSGICGSFSDAKRTKKNEVIEYLLEKNCLNKEECLMIGDKSQDVVGAELCGIDCVGVLWGYGSREELEKASYIVDKPKDLLGIL